MRWILQNRLHLYKVKKHRQNQSIGVNVGIFCNDKRGLGEDFSLLLHYEVAGYVGMFMK